MRAISKVIPYYDKQGYDVAICNTEQNLFAVFDGMGTSKGARRASKLAAGILQSHFETSGINDWRGLAYAFTHFNDVAKRDPSVGGTTGVAVFIERGGRVHYAAVGDSRLYVLRKGRVKQITSDEGVENMLLNYLGAGSIGVAQAGYIDEWDRLLLVSDGITGDREPDLVTDEEIESCLKCTKLADVVTTLVEVSSKSDDKTIVVVEQS